MIRHFVCPYCGEDHKEEDMKSHFVFFHDMGDESPSTIEAFQVRYSILGIAKTYDEVEDDD